MIATHSDSRLSDAVWLRLPQPGRHCALTGMTRSSQWSFVVRFGVRTISIRRPGAAKGLRLIDKADLLAKLDALAC